MSRPNRLQIAAIAAISLFVAERPVSAASFLYDTKSTWVSDSVGPFGAGGISTFGQTFVAPFLGPTLQNFSFHLNVDGPVELKAYVYEWSGPLTGWGGNAVGSALYSSLASIALNGDGTSFQSVVVNTGGVKLTAGGQYVAFVTISNSDDFAATTGQANFALTPDAGASAGGGGFVYARNGSDFGRLTSRTWNTMTDLGDLAWTAQFTPTLNPNVFPTPEPATASLLAIGLAGVAGYRWRRRSTRAPVDLA